MQQSSLNLYFSSPRASTISANALSENKLRRAKSTPRGNRKVSSMLKSIENAKQTILDVGQKGIGMEHCVKVWGVLWGIFCHLRLFWFRNTFIVNY
ncbi:unnamed protein product [Meloidogyne enterolobii]|uniref:Uncharacterized protein n=1 Tax=Meloidogyne enterolobii TaxID=390850 RepID=A0ACB0XZU7_MELEN